MSPRGTKALHHRRDCEHLAAVLLVLLERLGLGAKGPPVAKPGGAVDESPADRL
jgi:hypothetical protein